MKQVFYLLKSFYKKLMANTIKKQVTQFGLPVQNFIFFSLND